MSCVSPTATRRAWIALIGLTLFSAAAGETVFTAATALLVCVLVGIKGRLVIDYLIGLQGSHPGVRAAMLAYFIVLPALIFLAVVFPHILARLTTL